MMGSPRQDAATEYQPGLGADGALLNLAVRHYVSLPQASAGQRNQTLHLPPAEAALLLLNLYGWLLPTEHPARQGLVALYGAAEVARREAIVEQSILPVMAAVRQAGIALVYVADSSPAIALEHTHIRRVMVEHLGIDPLVDYAEEGNDPFEYASPGGNRIAYAPAVSPQPDDYYVRKWTYSAFHATRLDRLLRNLGTRVLLCAGFNGDSDLLCSLLEGHALGYRMVLLRDAHAALHLPSLEPAMDLTQRLELYAEGSLGFSAAPADLICACHESAERRDA